MAQVGSIQQKGPRYPNPQVRYSGTYGRIDFPEYRYQEFPKVVKKGKKEATVNSKKEELDFLTNTPDEVGDFTPAEIHPLQAENIDLANSVADKDREIAELREQLAKAAGMDNAKQNVKLPEKKTVSLAEALK